MAYDPVKAHEYYINYRKKGLKKGRKKGTKKTTKAKTVTLLGQSVAGLNDAGKVEAALIKERIKTEMNAKLAEAKTDEERAQIRADYSRKAMQEISALKADSKYARESKAKTTSAKKSGSSSKGGGGKAEKASEGKATGGKASGKSTGAKGKVSAKTLANLRTQIKSLRQLSRTVSAPQKQRITAVVMNLLKTLKALQ